MTWVIREAADGRQAVMRGCQRRERTSLSSDSRDFQKRCLAFGPVAAGPDGVVGIALLELDPDARADRGHSERRSAAHRKGRAWHRPAQRDYGNVTNRGHDSAKHEGVDVVLDRSAILAVEAFGRGYFGEEMRASFRLIHGATLQQVGNGFRVGLGCG